MLKRPLKLAYIHSDTPNNVRIGKCLRVFAEGFEQVSYIGATRTGAWDRGAEIAGVAYHIDERVARRGLSGLGTSLRWLGYVREQLLRIRPDVVIATNEDAVLPFTAGYYPRPPVLVCDLIDSLAIRTVDALRHLNPVWGLLSRRALAGVDGLVDVTDERLERHRSLPAHHAVIFNSPPALEPLTPRAGLPEPFVYVCGSILDGVSGAETLLAACGQVPGGARIVFAGRPIGAWMQGTFLKHALVTDLGETTPTGSMEIALASSAILAHYVPGIENHIYAAPNKLFDAMRCGVPLLINSECLVSAFARRYGFGLPTPYGDVPALAAAVAQAMAPGPALVAGCAGARHVFEREYAWEFMASRWMQFLDAVIASKLPG